MCSIQHVTFSLYFVHLFLCASITDKFSAFSLVFFVSESISIISYYFQTCFEASS